jgi:thymidylate synthase
LVAAFGKQDQESSMRQYLNAVKMVLANGRRKENRTGVDTISTFNVNYSIDLRHGFPLLTTKKINWKNIVIELLWFLSGRTDIRLLKNHGCKFWDAWADGEGRVPSAYGNFWRAFPVHDAEEGAFTEWYDSIRGEASNLGFNDQIAWVVDTLKENPTSRRMVVSAWAPGNAQTSSLPPCHCLFVVNVQQMLTFSGLLKPHLCLHLTQRSCDMGLGVPYNIASYALLMHLLSRFSGIPVGIFGHTLVDAHIYTCKPDGSGAEYDHIPALKRQLQRMPKRRPGLDLHPWIQTLNDAERLLEADTKSIMNHFQLVGYDPHPAIRMKVAV